MAEKEKVTTMVLKVDLQCHKCYKKVKKVLCKFPQIRDQTYDEKQNLVIIKVVCCSPEKIRDRICCKGGGAIKSIEIKEPRKPEPASTEKAKPPAEDKAKPPAEDKTKPPSEGKPPAEDKPPTARENLPAKSGPGPVHVGFPPVNVNACSMDCYHGHPGGLCHTGYGGVAPYIQYDGYYGRPVYDSYGGGRSYNTNYCVARSDCFSEENPQGCTVM